MSGEEDVWEKFYTYTYSQTINKTCRSRRLAEEVISFIIQAPTYLKALKV